MDFLDQVQQELLTLTRVVVLRWNRPWFPQIKKWMAGGSPQRNADEGGLAIRMTGRVISIRRMIRLG
jgi:hypothetical protein